VKKKERVVSGIRPTGKIHLGNYIGTLRNWVEIQNNNVYDCFYFIADLHSLTTSYNNPISIGDNLIDMYIDLLSVGLNPEKSTIFLQSAISGHYKLFLIYSMITPIGWLERNPTVKDMIRDYDIKDNVNYGLLGYPVLQASDITLYKGNYVPIGKDQLPHLELTREIVRRFNNIYGDFFPEPKEILSNTPYLLGLDGKKMSKSLGNTINISANNNEIWNVVKNAVTDPERVYKTDPGHPEICNIFQYNKIFNFEKTETLKSDCINAKIGCMDCKKELSKVLTDTFKPIREKRIEIENDINHLENIKSLIFDGTEKAKKVAEETINEIFDIFHMRLF